MTHTTHPACCKDPDHCSLSYRDHLVGFGLSATIIPNRAVTRTEGLPDEPTTQTLTRDKRWERDSAAYRRLHKEGLRPPRMEGSALREKQGETEFDINHRKVKIDYNDPK